ncbi:MAG: glycoside hydrolase family 5 protein [Thermofilaceae archaeon]
MPTCISKATMLALTGILVLIPLSLSQPPSSLSQVNCTAKLHFCKCINIGNALEAPVEGQWGVYIRDEFLKIIREAGFEAVRIPIRWSSHAEKNPPYAIDEKFFQRVDHVIDKALEQGLYVIINVHHYEEIMQKPLDQKERFMAIWQQISARYKDYPDRLIFELLNEPCNELTADIWNQLMRETIDIIRITNPTRKIVVGPVNWNSPYALQQLQLPENDENIIVTFHFYTPFEFTHQGAEWVSPSPRVGVKWYGTRLEQREVTRELDIAANWAEQYGGVPLLMGEFGAYSKADMESRIRWTYLVAREAEKRGIAWCYWEFAAGFGIYDQFRGRWRTELLEALFPGNRTMYLVTVDTQYGTATGEGLYWIDTYARISINPTKVGPYVFDHFEGLKEEDRIVDPGTVEIYVNGPRTIKAVWRLDYIEAFLPFIIMGIIGILLILASIVILSKKQIKKNI